MNRGQARERGCPTYGDSGFYRHCAPLEYRRWTYRDSIDISLRWSERHIYHLAGAVLVHLLGFAFAQPNLRFVEIGRGEFSSPDGLGDPTPTF